MDKQNVVIIGAGQLGSRHLQGVLKCKWKLDVWVVDPNEDSLYTAKLREAEVDHSNVVTYVKSLDKLPIDLDVVIVATNSNVRAQLVKDLVNERVVKHLILEKVLFQKVSDYDEIETLLKKKGIPTYVNHPRRLQSFYQELQKEIKDSSIKQIICYGQNWGLACNGLHLIDLVAFLKKENIQNLCLKELDTDILESKRAGYIEVTGKMTGKTISGMDFSITSSSAVDDIVEPISISIFTPEKRFFIQEGAITYVSRSEKANSFETKVASYPMKFQSELSGIVVSDLLEHGETGLPTLAEASATHKLFISQLNKFLFPNSNDKDQVCPIT